MGYFYSKFYNGSTSVTVPNGCVSLGIECIAGGGAGAGENDAISPPIALGGGAGGGYSKTTINYPTAGHTISITIGAQRVGIYGDALDGNDTFVFVNSVEVCRAKGGGSAVGNTGGLGTIIGAIGDIKYAGGNGSNGTTTLLTYYSGPGGGAGGENGIGGNGNYITGFGGVGNGLYSGNGGIGQRADDDYNGFNGLLYGGGGGGGMNFNLGGQCLGGSGRTGLVLIFYYMEPLGHFLILP